MNPMQAVARTDQPQTWPTAPPVSEGEPTPLKSSGQPRAITYTDVLRAGSAWLQAGWRWLERRRAQQLSSRRLRLAETISLGEKRSISIVQVDGAQFLIGCSAGSVQLLAVLDRQNDGIMRAAVTSDIERAA